MKGFVEMKCTTLGVETTCCLKDVSISDKAHLFHCLKQALEVDALEWQLISGFLEFLEQVDAEDEDEDEDVELQEFLNKLLGGNL